MTTSAGDGRDLLAGWDRGLEDGRLRFPRCTACGAWNWYPLPRCRTCGGDAIEWVEVEATGRIYSWTRVHRSFGGDPVAALPYVTAIVDIDAAPGVRLVCLQRPGEPDPIAGGAVRITLERTTTSGRWVFEAAR